jgi:hypothetical protein
VTNRSTWSRRAWLAGAGAATAARLPTTGSGAPAGDGPGLDAAHDAFLNELERRCFRYFWEAADPSTGLVRDRWPTGGPDGRTIGSIAATGFGLTALCIGHQRKFGDPGAIASRARATLDWLAHHQPQEHGFFYHFFDVRSGERIWNCELSSIDTAILLCGVLTCRQHFDDPEVRRLAGLIFDRADWDWMRNGRDALCHGWKPESGFLRNYWDHYCELMMIYLLGLGSQSHPLPTTSWGAWSRPVTGYGGHRYVGGRDPLFVHQFSHAWFDFRGRPDRGTDWFQNSVAATRAHRQFCLDLQPRFPGFGADLWGVTASDSEAGYQAWGGPPEIGRLDGTVVPCAAAGSLPFLSAECLRTLTFMRTEFGERVWGRYGFTDAFNPHSGWTNPDVIGIDVGISLLMAENLRTGFVWETFMKDDVAKRGMERAGMG